MRNSLRGAGMSPDEIGHIHAHGLSTRSCDIDEAKAIREVFGAAADKVPVTAAKSYFGNLGAGSGMIELIASVLALSNGKLFPVLNYETPDPECPHRRRRSEQRQRQPRPLVPQSQRHAARPSQRRLSAGHAVVCLHF